ncbi:MAG: hypothetical protein K2X41_09595 [Hyphomicrobium sp.]|nr:hypothetical protein [Hyphomicrobium sp.]
MLRRYLIINGITTAAFYGAYWAVVPSMATLVQSIRQGIDLYAMDHTLLGPIVYRMLTLTST